MAAVAIPLGIAAAATSLVSTGVGFAQEISGSALEQQEARRFYKREIGRLEEKQGEATGEAERQIGSTMEAGVAGLREQGAQAAYETKLATIKTELTTSSEEARLGRSGARMGGSPLLAAQQNVNLAAAAAERSAEAGMSAVTIGGIKLKSELGGIAAQHTLLTSEYERQREEALYRYKRAGGEAYDPEPRNPYKIPRVSFGGLR